MTSTAGESVALSGLEPRACWKHFQALTRIPRPSLGEEPVIEHVRTWAARSGFELRQDAARNLLVRVPATVGRESAPTVILQGHLDMVCERRPDSPHDPAEGRIALERDGDWLRADGTTLGADNGNMSDVGSDADSAADAPPAQFQNWTRGRADSATSSRGGSGQRWVAA